MDVTIAGWVYLPIDQLEQYQIDNIKRDLTLYPRKTTNIANTPNPEPIFMYYEDSERGLLGIPRNYYLDIKTMEHNEVLDLSYGEPMGSFESKVRMDGNFAEQKNALQTLEHALLQKKWGGVILEAGCGSGKTTMGLELARRLGKATIILIHKEFLEKQWIARIKQVMPDAKVGIIRQKKCDYHGKDFVIAYMPSLARDEDGRYPEEIYRSAFGTLIVDEGHRLGSATWSKLAPKFHCTYRVLLSATLRRADKCERVFFDHIGPITYTFKTQTMVPEVRKLYTYSELKGIKRGKYSVSADKLNSAQMLTQIARDINRNKDISDQIVGAVKAGRKVFVLSERLEQLRVLSEMFNNSQKALGLNATYDFYTGEWFDGVYEKKVGKHKKGSPKMKKRTESDLKTAESAQVIFATKQLAFEGMDITALDVFVMGTPLGDIEQPAGRVRRWCYPEEEKCKRLCPWRFGRCKGKPTPIILDVIDKNVKAFQTKYYSRVRFYKEIGVKKL